MSLLSGKGTYRVARHPDSQLARAAESLGKEAMKIFLHIGSEKTGTTSLQAWCRTNQEFLQDIGICYPSSLGHRGNHVLVPCYAAPDEKVRDLRLITSQIAPESVAAFREELPERLRKEISDRNPDAILVSNEHLSSRLGDLGEVRRVKELFDRVAPAAEYRIILYIRRQDDMVQSIFSTAVKSGGSAPFRLTPRLNDRRLNPLLVIDLWSEVFGESNVVVRVFDRKRLVAGDIVHDVMHQIGIAIPEGDERIQPVRVLNTRLSGEALEFLRLLNQHVPRFTETGLNEERQQILHALERLPGNSAARLMTTAQAREFLSHYESINNEIARRFFSTEEGPLFAPIPGSEAPEPTSVPLLGVEEAVRIAAHLLVGRSQLSRAEKQQNRGALKAGLGGRHRRKPRSFAG